MKRKILISFFVVGIIGCLSNLPLQKISMPQKGFYDDVVWSPNGKQVLAIFTSNQPFETRFYLYDLPSQEWAIIEEISDFSLNADWIDEETIVYETSDLDDNSSFRLKSSLVFYNLTTYLKTQSVWGSSIQDIKKRPFYNELAVQRDITYNHSGIYLHDIKTHHESLLYNPLPDESVREITWSPDGKLIAFILAKDNPLKITPLYFHSLNLLDIVTGETKTLIEYSKFTLDEISWSNINGITVREIGDNYDQGISVFSITQEGEKGYIDLYGITPIKVTFFENTALVTSLGYPGSNDIFLLVRENQK